jgi:hypothetical protein
VTILEWATVEDLESTFGSAGKATLILIKTGEQNMVVCGHFCSTQFMHVLISFFFDSVHDL